MLYYVIVQLCSKRAAVATAALVRLAFALVAYRENLDDRKKNTKSKTNHNRSHTFGKCQSDMI